MRSKRRFWPIHFRFLQCIFFIFLNLTQFKNVVTFILKWIIFFFFKLCFLCIGNMHEVVKLMNSHMGKLFRFDFGMLSAFPTVHNIAKGLSGSPPAFSSRPLLKSCSTVGYFVPTSRSELSVLNASRFELWISTMNCLHCGLLSNLLSALRWRLM